jgi:hypothetical protein
LGDQNFLVAKSKEKIKVIGQKVFWSLFEKIQLLIDNGLISPLI